MALNEQFFAGVRSSLYKGTISQNAMDGMNAICLAFDGFSGGVLCTDDLAAILAACYLETGPEFRLSVREVGMGKGHDYGKVAGPYNQIYYGRGPCQITWLANYTVAQKRTGVDFVQYPDYMLDPKYGIPYMIDAMYAGLFTKKGLRNFITPGVPTSSAQFGAARDIINPGDKRILYASYCTAFQAALGNGYVKVPKAQPTPVAKQVPTTIVGRLLAGLAELFHSKNG